MSAITCACSGSATALAEPAEPVFFVFNGDADGLFSQHILELEGIRPSARVTGLKREVRLLGRLPVLESARIHVFDISIDANRAELDALLLRDGVRVDWYDHHDATNPPSAANFTPHLSQAREACTAVLVNAVCGGRRPLWASAAAFGDNVTDTARALLAGTGLQAEDAALLRDLGVLINYNAYGETPDDVLIPPADLAGMLIPFAHPLAFARETDVLPRLRVRFQEDKALCERVPPALSAPHALAYRFPPESWARRYAPTWANAMQRDFPSKALAFLMEKQSGNYAVSIRAPREGAGSALRASDLAREFSGGGRRGAAGINDLPASETAGFLNRFEAFFKE